MALAEEFSKLESYFGKENILIEYLVPEEGHFDDQLAFSKVQITHLPSGKVVEGLKYDTQMANAVFALNELKRLLG